MADESGNNDLRMGMEVSNEDANAALDESDRKVKAIGMSMEEVARKSKAANDEVAKGGEIARELEGQFSGLQSAIIGAFSVTTVQQFFAAVDEGRKRMAAEEGADRRNLAGVLGATGDLADPAMAKAIQQRLERIDDDSVLGEQDVQNLYGNVRGVLPRSDQRDRALDITGIIAEQGGALSAEQRNQIVQLMAQREALAPGGNLIRGFDQAFKISSGAGSSAEDVIGSFRDIAGATGIDESKAGDLFDVVATLVATAKQRGQDKMPKALLDAMAAAGEKTITVGGKKQQAAPTIAAMMERDPVAAIEAAASGNVPEDELTELLGAERMRGMKVVQREFARQKRNMIGGRIGDLAGGAEAILGEEGDSQRARSRYETLERERQDFAAAYTARQKQDELRNRELFGPYAGGAVSMAQNILRPAVDTQVQAGALGARDQLLEGIGQLIGKMERFMEASIQRQGAGSQGSPFNPTVNVTVTVDKDLDARATVQPF